MTQLKVGVVGLGYWGPKLARCFKELGVLEAVCDVAADRLDKALPLGAKQTQRLESFLALVDAVAIATPPETHHTLAKQALEAGKHVFVEKPLATSYNEAVGLVRLAEAKQLTLKVGHIYLHCPGFMAVPRPVGAADLYVRLLNVAGPPSNSTRDLIWAGLPHAASIALSFFPKRPDSMEVSAAEHRIQVRLRYWNGSKAFFDVGDYTGVKIRAVELRIGERSYLYDGDSPNEYTLYSGMKTEHVTAALDSKEPLVRECEDFLKGGIDYMAPVAVGIIQEIQEIIKVGRR